MHSLELKARLKGVQTIVPTPFEDTFELNEAGLCAIIDFLLDSGIRFITPMGSGGEFPSLSRQEQRRVVEIAVGQVRSKTRDCLVIPGFGSPSLHEVIEFCRFALDTGADGVMLTPPFYYRLGFEQAYQFYKAVNDSVEIPIVFYYYPSLHPIKLTASQILEILKLPHVVAIKETSLDMIEYDRLGRSVGNDAVLISGAGEWLTPYTYLAGFKGFTTLMPNFCPEIPLGIHKAGIAGDIATVKRIVDSIGAFLDWWWDNGGPDLTKILMTWKGLPGGPVRPPLLPKANPESLEELRHLMTRLKMI